MKKVCIVGGGAAGLMAAYAAAKNGNDVLLFEKNEKLGKKSTLRERDAVILPTTFLPTNFWKMSSRGRKFLTGAVWSFPPKSVMEFFISHGLPLKTERGGRVFPVSDHASDVTKTLEKACRSVGVQFLLNEKVVCLQTSMSDVDIMPRIVAVRTEKGKYECGEAIVCTGGLSYPSTGSTGDGYRFADEAGLRVTDLRPGLCGIELKGALFKDLQGLSLKNVALKAKNGKKLIYDGFGECFYAFRNIGAVGALSFQPDQSPRLKKRDSGTGFEARARQTDVG